MDIFFNADYEEEVTDPEPEWAEEVFALALDPPQNDPYFARRLIEMLKTGDNTFWKVRAKMQVHADSRTFKEFCKAFDGYFLAIQENGI